MREFMPVRCAPNKQAQPEPAAPSIGDCKPSVKGYTSNPP
jgi:hypothetical protein